MTERIDHAAEAKKLIENAYSDDPALLDGIRAVAHATLALVEEQRTANRIALAVAIRGDLELGDSADELSDWLHEGNGVRGYFSEAEKEALGIGCTYLTASRHVK